MKKKILVIALAIMIVFASFSVVYGISGDDVKGTIGDVNNQGKDMGAGVQSILKVVLGVVRIAGMGIAVIMILSFGIKYMASMPADRAAMMKQSVVYLIGALLLFGASFIVGVVAEVVGTATGG